MAQSSAPAFTIGKEKRGKTQLFHSVDKVKINDEVRDAPGPNSYHKDDMSLSILPKSPEYT